VGLFHAADRRRSASRLAHDTDIRRGLPRRPMPKPWRRRWPDRWSGSLALISGVTAMSSTQLARPDPPSRVEFDLSAGSIEWLPAPGCPDRDQRGRAGTCRKNLPSPPTYEKANPADAQLDVDCGHLRRPCRSRPVPNDYVENYLAPRISRHYRRLAWSISTVSKSRPVRVQINPQIASAMGISLEDVRAAIGNRDGRHPEGDAGWLQAIADPRYDRPDFRRRGVRNRSSSPIATARRCGFATSARRSTGSRTFDRRRGSWASGP